MRFWAFRRRIAAVPPLPSDDLLITEDLLRRNVEDVLAVRGREIRGGVICFRGDLMTTPGCAVDILSDRFRRMGYTPVMRGDGDGVVVQAWPVTETGARPRVSINVLLFVLTCLSTLVAGWFFAGSPTFDALRRSNSLAQLLAGVPFATTLLAILGVHEFGHYFTARYHRASVSLPYFIPAPPPLFMFGTLGAIIRMRSQPKDRNALFDIAAAGPLAGLVVALPAILIGLEWSRVTPVPPGGYIAFGDSLLMRFLVQLRFGDIPEGMMLFTHPMADAAWAGLLVTALNLFPVGQLDGGRIAYALFGRRHRAVGVATFVALLLMGTGIWLVTGMFEWAANWFVWAALMYFVIGFHHTPPLDDLTPLTPGRRVVGFACLAILILLVPPVLIQGG